MLIHSIGACAVACVCLCWRWGLFARNRVFWQPMNAFGVAQSKLQPHADSSWGLQPSCNFAQRSCDKKNFAVIAAHTAAWCAGRQKMQYCPEGAVWNVLDRRYSFSPSVSRMLSLSEEPWRPPLAAATHSRAKLRSLGNIQECIGSAAVAFFLTMRRACVAWMLGADGGGELVEGAPGSSGSSSSSAPLAALQRQPIQNIR